MRNSFQSTLSSGVVLWTGNPDCQAGHHAVLEWLTDNAAPFLPSVEEDDTRLLGNLGETVSMCIGVWNHFETCHCFPSNALTPFRKISKPEIDIVWVAFGQTPETDFVVLQEVKTTGGVDLSYANQLLDDFE